MFEGVVARKVDRGGLIIEFLVTLVMSLSRKVQKYRSGHLDGSYIVDGSI